MTVLPDRCLARIQLADDQVAWLSERRFPAHEVRPYPYCELEMGHREPHAALGQQGDGVEWWVRWTLAASEIVKVRACPAQTQGIIDEDDGPDGCLLFEGHPGSHSFELRQNVRHTV